MQSGDFKALVQSAIDGDLALAHYFLSLGVDPSFLHPGIMTTPLIEAAKTSNVEMFKLLLNHGADPNLVSLVGESAYEIAKNQNQQEFIALLPAGKKSPFSLHQFFKKFS